MGVIGREMHFLVNDRFYHRDLLTDEFTHYKELYFFVVSFYPDVNTAQLLLPCSLDSILTAIMSSGSIKHNQIPDGTGSGMLTFNKDGPFPLPLCTCTRIYKKH